ncbi:MAG: ECF transporter S component [Lachnospiraceae bacterium]|nr:ECF transporter S component [Lachnospiraceae bacterium]
MTEQTEKNAALENSIRKENAAGRKSAKRSGISVRYMTVTAMLSALAFILMFFDFSVPLMPSFIKMDISELPALVGAFSMGPSYGVLICLIKNLLHLTITKTGGVGELSNFMLGAVFVFTAGMIYKRNKTKKNALIGSLIGAVAMALASIVSNYFIAYPFYTSFMPMEAIIGMYQAILPSADSLIKCLVIFNVPFTFIKGMVSVIITMLIYKKISPIIKGNER